MLIMEAIKLNNKRIISLSSAKNIILGLIVIILFDFFLFPLPTLANEAVKKAMISEEVSAVLIKAGELELSDQEIISHLPENGDKKVVRSAYYAMTAYNSEAAQTDASPCVTANGFNVCEYGVEDTVAANFLPFGTKLRIPNLFGDRVFVVRDRMNARYTDRLDVWMLEKQDAKKFGVKLAKIEVLEP